MKIAFLDTKTMGNVPNLNIFEKFGEVTFYEVTKPEDTISRLKNVDCVITCKVILDKSVLQQLPNLKLICIAATGTNNVDLDYAAKAGIIVKNVAGYSTNSVAQATFAMVLALLNNTIYYDSYVKSGMYARNDMFTHMDASIFELNERTYGIIGMGAIGRNVAKIAQAFGCKICYYSTSGKNYQQDYEQVDLDTLLRKSDIVSIHAPLNDNTRNLIHLEKLKLMKPSAILINMARGGIVNEQDLAKALNNGIIAGAGSDVFSKEPIEAQNPLLSGNDPGKLILTPHCAWASIEARTLLIQKIADNISSYLRERKTI